MYSVPEAPLTKSINVSNCLFKGLLGKIIPAAAEPEIKRYNTQPIINSCLPCFTLFTKASLSNLLLRRLLRIIPDELLFHSFILTSQSSRSAYLPPRANATKTVSDAGPSAHFKYAFISSCVNHFSGQNADDSS